MELEVIGRLGGPQPHGVDGVVPVARHRGVVRHGQHHLVKERWSDPVSQRQVPSSRPPHPASNILLPAGSQPACPQAVLLLPQTPATRPVPGCGQPMGSPGQERLWWPHREGPDHTLEVTSIFSRFTSFNTGIKNSSHSAAQGPPCQPHSRSVSSHTF